MEVAVLAQEKAAERGEKPVGPTASKKILTDHLASRFTCCWRSKRPNSSPSSISGSPTLVGSGTRAAGTFRKRFKINAHSGIKNPSNHLCRGRPPQRLMNRVGEREAVQRRVPI